MTKTRFGRMRGGHSTSLLLSLSLLIGIALSVLLGWLASTRSPGISPWIVILINIVCCAPVLCVGAWALLADLKTVKGRADRVEDSVENAWADSAAAGMGTDLMIILGLLTAVVSVGQIELPTDALVFGLLILAMLSFALRYWTEKRKGS